MRTLVTFRPHGGLSCPDGLQCMHQRAPEKPLLFLRRLLYTEPVLPFQTTTDAPLLLRTRPVRGPGDVKQLTLFLPRLFA